VLQQITLLLQQHVEWLFVSSDGGAHALRRSEIEVAVSHNRLLLSCWTENGNRTWRILDWQWNGGRLLLHASRNGFFYVFDRRDGTLLLTRPFVRNLTWASGIGADGRPIKLPNQEPSRA